MKIHFNSNSENTRFIYGDLLGGIFKKKGTENSGATAEARKLSDQELAKTLAQAKRDAELRRTQEYANARANARRELSISTKAENEKDKNTGKECSTLSGGVNGKNKKGWFFGLGGDTTNHGSYSGTATLGKETIKRKATVTKAVTGTYSSTSNTEYSSVEASINITGR